MSNDPNSIARNIAKLKIGVDSVRGSVVNDVLPAVIEIRNGTIAEVRARHRDETVDLEFAGYFAMPGLVDTHAHIGAGISRYGVDRNGEDGVVALLSQGDAGHRNLLRFEQDGGPTKRFALHVEPFGEEFVNVANPRLEVGPLTSALQTPSVWGISVNLSRNSTRDRSVDLVWEVALEAAQACGAPFLFGPREPADWPLDQQLALLRPGDILTYLYRSTPYSLFSSAETIEAVLNAQGRGVVLDACHGSASFDFQVVEQAASSGVQPTTVSSDLSTLCSNPLSASLPRVISKLVAAGLDRELILDAASTTPGRILGIDNQIAEGTTANITIAKWGPNETFSDTSGSVRTGSLLEVGATISNGRVLFVSGS